VFSLTRPTPSTASGVDDDGDIVVGKSATKDSDNRKCESISSSTLPPQREALNFVSQKQAGGGTLKSLRVELCGGPIHNPPI